MRKAIVGSAVCLALTAVAAQAQPASVAEGYRLSSDLCVRCHVITAERQGSWTDAPPFESIANRAGMTRNWLVEFIPKPHGHMLTRDYTAAQVTSIANYIMSLRRQ